MNEEAFVLSVIMSSFGLFSAKNTSAFNRNTRITHSFTCIFISKIASKSCQ